MPDVFTIAERSAVMRNVKSKSNKSTELKLIKFFKSNSIKGWRRHYKMYGKPDFVFTKTKTAIFLDGCFWHGHNCRNLMPKSNVNYWEEKISKNKKRDIEVNDNLSKKGWQVIRIWECNINDTYLENVFLAQGHILYGVET